MHAKQLANAFVAVALGVKALDLQPDNHASVKSAASTLADGLMNPYKSSIGARSSKTFRKRSSPGLLPPPYYWYQAGAAWGAMIDYWAYTGDSSHNDLVSQAILSQVSPTNDFWMSSAQPIGNDDQAWWGLTAMSAVERGFPNPPSSQPQWLDLAKKVFNDLSGRWDTSLCNGGLRWQPFNVDGVGGQYDQKSAIANGLFFQLAARLARHTGDTKYTEWAEKTYDWVTRINLIGGPNEGHGAKDFNVFDGSQCTDLNCTQVDHDLWSYNAGTYLLGVATMASITPSGSPWAAQASGHLTATQTSFVYKDSGILWDPNCETQGGTYYPCDTDQAWFKGYLARWMAQAAQLQPQLKSTVKSILSASAQAVAKACPGPTDVCGMVWTSGASDGIIGEGQQVSAMSATIGLLGVDVEAPRARGR